ncbi:unnamed protein product [Ostreobium quekettii]|uniref:Uncharacterized protein n=1 Tax=Ostreobium quekettii TaxID=121088 RepID=A0A8S1IWU4_9CHLO|nr:unnamed protein product [Ostreobium quekettii]|eukprot:evm.model.scf_894.1 EVM.evm.TU.scf_894.1   scf_894:15815-23166(+)
MGGRSAIRAAVIAVLMAALGHCRFRVTEARNLFQQNPSATLREGLAAGPVPLEEDDDLPAVLKDENLGANEAWFTAAESGNITAINSMLDNGVDPNAARDDGSTALILAARFGHKAIVVALLEASAQVNGYDNSGDTALLAASSAGHVDVVSLLLQAGADPSHSNDLGLTALSAAAQAGHAAVLALLPGQPPDLSVALLVAAEAGQTAAVSALIKRDVDLEMRSPRHSGATVLGVAAAVPGGEEVVRELLRAGADVGATNADGWTPLHWAAAFGDGSVVEALLEGGAQVEVREGDGLTPLMVAAARGNVATARALVGAGADVNARSTETLQTPLHFVLTSGNLKLLDLLLKSGADPKIKDINGDTPGDVLDKGTALPDLSVTQRRVFKFMMGFLELSDVKDGDIQYLYSQLPTARVDQLLAGRG